MSTLEQPVEAGAIIGPALSLLPVPTDLTEIDERVVRTRVGKRFLSVHVPYCNPTNDREDRDV